MLGKIRPLYLFTIVIVVWVCGAVANVCLAEDKPKFPTVQSITPGEKQSDLASKEDFDCGETKGSIKVKHGPISVKLSNGKVQNIPDAITITYTGKNCPDCVWVQFIWRKVIVTVKDGTTDVDKTLTGKAVVPYADPTNGQEKDYSYDLTTDEKKEPKWNVDSPHYGKDPTFSANKGCLQVSNCPTSLVGDAPTPLFGYNRRTSELLDSYTLDDTNKKILKEATKVRALLHADTFLVCKGKPCARVSWNATWTFDVSNGKVNQSKFSVTPAYSDVSIDPGAKLTGEQTTALNDQFKGQQAVQ